MKSKSTRHACSYSTRMFALAWHLANPAVNIACMLAPVTRASHSEVEKSELGNSRKTWIRQFGRNSEFGTSEVRMDVGTIGRKKKKKKKKHSTVYKLFEKRRSLEYVKCKLFWTNFIYSILRRSEHIVHSVSVMILLFFLLAMSGEKR
jgi:hypothetical protein